VGRVTLRLLDEFGVPENWLNPALGLRLEALAIPACSWRDWSRSCLSESETDEAAGFADGVVSLNEPGNGECVAIVVMWFVLECSTNKYVLFLLSSSATTMYVPRCEPRGGTACASRSAPPAWCDVSRWCFSGHSQTHTPQMCFTSFTPSATAGKTCSPFFTGTYVLNTFPECSVHSDMNLSGI
jgi:hypothetical protein